MLHPENKASVRATNFIVKDILKLLLYHHHNQQTAVVKRNSFVETSMTLSCSESG